MFGKMQDVHTKKRHGDGYCVDDPNGLKYVPREVIQEQERLEKLDKLKETRKWKIAAAAKQQQQQSSTSYRDNKNDDDSDDNDDDDNMSLSSSSSYEDVVNDDDNRDVDEIVSELSKPSVLTFTDLDRIEMEKREFLLRISGGKIPAAYLMKPTPLLESTRAQMMIIAQKEEEEKATTAQSQSQQHSGGRRKFIVSKKKRDDDHHHQ